MKTDETDDDDFFSDYSDDFEEVGSPVKSTKIVRKPSSYDDTVSDTRSTESPSLTQTVKSDVVSATKKKPPTNKWRSHSMTREIKQKARDRRKQESSLQLRMRSARRNRVNELNNDLTEAHIKLEELRKENRLLKTLQHRQDKALKRLEDTENDLPRIISQHMEEQRVLRARLRKSHDSERITENKLRKANDEIQKMESTLRRFKKMVYDRNLGERADLQKKLMVAEDKLSDLERTNRDLEKKVDLTSQYYMRQLKAEKIKHKETKASWKELHNEFLTLKNQLKEKERALQVTNIYALRGIKQSPEKSFLTSTQSSPRVDPQPPVQKQLAIIEEPPTTSTDEGEPPPPPLPSIKTSTPVKEPKPKRKSVPETSVFLTAPEPTNLDLTSDSSVSPGPNAVEQDSIDEISTVKPSIPEPSLVSEPALKPPPVPKAAPVPKAPPRQATMTMNFVKSKNDEDAKAAEAAEQQRKKKAALLAKMKQLEQEEQSGMTSPTLMTSPVMMTSSPAVVPPIATQQKKKQITNDDLDSILGINSTVNGGGTSLSLVSSPPQTQSTFNASSKPPVHEVENLHLGKPSNSELSFGGYAPSISNNNSRRKGRPLADTNNYNSSTNSDSDTPLFDLNKPNKGTESTKKPDLLQQLFGEPTQPKVGSKPAPRKPTVNSGYPWEKNVIASPTQGKPFKTVGNGTDNSFHRSSATRNSLIMSPLVKSRSLINEDDIEELAL